MSYQEHRPTGFKVLPDVVKNLLIINGLVFLATVVLSDVFQLDLVGSFALYHWGSEHFEPYQFITHLFLHGGISHIFFNMFALWMFGNALENVWGGKRFLVYYLVTGMGAGVIHLLYSSIGISGMEAAARAFENTPSIETLQVFISDYVPGVYKGSFMQVRDAMQYSPGNTQAIQQANQY